MKSWRLALGDGCRSGAVASLLSAFVLAIASRSETGSPFACLNATSHWLWKDESARHLEASVRYTVSEYLIHHAASCFWGTLYERFLGERVVRHRPQLQVLAGLGAAAVACMVDYRAVPPRLSPGFELRLSRRSIAAGYLAFGLDLALAGLARPMQAGRSGRPARLPDSCNLY